LSAQTSPQSAGRDRPHSNLTMAMLALAGIALFITFMALGTWQVERRAWKLQVIERVSQRLHMAPIAMPPPSAWPAIDAASHEYQPVQVQGHWLPEKTVLTQATTELGAGFWVLTPLQQADGSQVLINRGFVPQDQRAQWQPPSSADPARNELQVQITGLMRMSEPRGGFLRTNDPAQQRWHSRDVDAIAHAQHLQQAAPFFIDAGLPAQGHSAAPVSGNGSWPRAGMTVVRFHNSHMVYLLTWYGLALMVAGAAVVVARYELRLRAAFRNKHPDEQQR
jgi:surfeit locus 1 family protein